MNPTSSAEERRALGFRLGRLLGVEVRLDWSLLLIFALIAFNLAVGLFPLWHPTWSGLARWGTALAAATLFLASVLAHELSHALAGRALGTPVHGITLFLFGGMTRLSGEPRSPGRELIIAGVGPVVSLAIGVAASVAGYALVGSSRATAQDFDLVMREAGPVATLLVWLGPVNIALGVFNLLPGFPLDGGRVLRALFWIATKDFVKATRWAAVGGQVFAALLVGFGVINALSGNIGQGLWLMLIGWFLGSAARSTWMHVLVKHSLRDLPVASVMRAHFDRVSPDLSVAALVRDHLMATEQRAWPVVRDGKLEGLVVWNDVRRVPQSLWEQTPIAVVMTPRTRLATVFEGDRAEVALDLMAQHDIDQLPVLRGDALTGVVRRADLLKWIALHDDRHHHGPLAPLSR